jgi:hypothetical protein
MLGHFIVFHFGSFGHRSDLLGSRGLHELVSRSALLAVEERGGGQRKKYFLTFIAFIYFAFAQWWCTSAISCFLTN